MRLSRPITTWATTSIHSRGVSPWLRPRSNKSTESGIWVNRGSSASLRISRRATSASRRSTTTPVRSAASIRACRSASRSRIGRGSVAALPLSCASDISTAFYPLRTGAARAVSRVNLAATKGAAKGVCSQRVKSPAFASSRPRGSRCQAEIDTTVNGPTRKNRMGPLARFLGRFLSVATGSGGRDPGGLFHDREAHTGLVTVLFRDRAPGILGFLAGLERTLHLGRPFHELVEVHRSELAANHPEIAAFGHDSLLLWTGY